MNKVDHILTEIKAMDKDAQLQLLKKLEAFIQTDTKKTQTNMAEEAEVPYMTVPEQQFKVNLQLTYEQFINLWKQLPVEAQQQFLEKKEKQPPTGKKGFGSLKGKIHMSDDFDAPLEDMKDYMY